MKRLVRDALKDQMHRAIYDRCEYLLAHRGYFSKKEALRVPIKDLTEAAGEEHKGFAMADFSYCEASVYWTAIRTLLQGKNGADSELMALSERFFKFHTERDLKDMPEKFLASVGGGKRTAGYGMFGCGNGHLALRVIKQRERVLKGVAKSVETNHKAAHKAIETDPENLPDGMGWADDAPTPNTAPIDNAVKKLDAKIDRSTGAYDAHRSKVREDILREDHEQRAIDAKVRGRPTASEQSRMNFKN